jgi:AdoMet-dependent heme synthase
MANVLMTQNLQDYPGGHALAAEMGAECTLDPTLTPMMDGNRSAVELGVHPSALRQVFRDLSLVGDADEFCAIPAEASESELESIPCGAGHAACYVSPPGDVFPCVQFPLPTGNVGQQCFVDICRHSGQMDDVRSRSIRLKDLTTCTSCSHVGSCTRCPGLAYLDGNMRGPSTPDCEKSFVRAGIPSANMLAKPSAGVSAGQANLSQANLVQMRAFPASIRNASASASA